MKKFLFIMLFVLILLPLTLAAGCYAAVSYQYKDTFMPGLVINGIYASDLSVSEMSSKLSEAEKIPVLVVTEKSGKEHSFHLEEIHYKADYTSELQKLKDKQSVITFIDWFINEDNSTKDVWVDADYSYDEQALGEYFEQSDYLKDNSDPKGKKVEVRYSTMKGYYLYDETVALLSHDKAVSAITSAIDNKVFSVDLYKEDCYVQVEHTSQMQDALDLWEQLSPYMNTVVCYQFDDKKVAIDAVKISQLLAKEEDGTLAYDEDGKIFIDEAALKAYVHQFVEDYSTVKKPRDFRTTRGDIVSVTSTTYGIKIDEKEEYEYLRSALKNGRQQTRIPQLTQTNYTGICGLNDIGDTYIEVDMTNQHMYYYQNGRLKLSTDVVTGCTGLGRGTPQMVCFVYGKQKNRVLRGEGYASFVNFWIPVNKGIGIHDASWRSQYGGEIYKRSGSHGCINTPYDQVSKLYDMVEIGTPVVIFY